MRKVITLLLFVVFQVAGCGSKDEMQNDVYPARGRPVPGGDIEFTFRPSGTEHPAEVRLAGNFNRWNPDDTNTIMTTNDGVWKTTIRLDPGQYLFTFIIDGIWIRDMREIDGKFTPAAAGYFMDDYSGGIYAILKVKEPE